VQLEVPGHGLHAGEVPTTPGDGHWDVKLRTVQGMGMS
jgi:hypothetical protein